MKQTPIFFCRFQSPVELPAGADTKLLPEVWKIFSQSPLTDDELDSLFEFRNDTKVADWLAYPHYRVQQTRTLGKFRSVRRDIFNISLVLYCSITSTDPCFHRLHDGLCHANAVEWAASAMEMAVLGGTNCALATLNHLNKFHIPSGDQLGSGELREEL